LGAAATGFRQNNIVWVALIMGWRLLEDAPAGDAQEIKGKGKGKAEGDSSGGGSRHGLGGPRIPFLLVRHVFSRLYSVGWPYIALIIAFVAFVVHNGSIVVGDTSAHEASTLVYEWINGNSSILGILSIYGHN